MFDFWIQQVVNLQFLSVFFDYLLSLTPLSHDSSFYKFLHFFLYDSSKIMILLVVLIFIISFAQSFIDVKKSKAIISKTKGLKAHIISALLGTITPFCSCSSIPLFIAFTKAKFPIGVTFSFLISSPMVDLASIILISTIFNLKIAIAYVLLGLVVAIAGGLLIDKLNLTHLLKEVVKSCNCSADDREDTANETLKLSFKSRLIESKNNAFNTLKKLYVYILLGVLIGALIHNYVPASMIVAMLGHNQSISVIIASIIGAPVYADIFGVLPIGEVLLNKGASLGTVLAFMMSVTTLSIPSLILLSRVVKVKLLTIFISICVSGIILCGFCFNYLQALLV